MNQHLRNLFKFRDLFLELVRKDIKLKYRNSYIGILWSMLNPLLTMLILTVIFSSVFRQNIENFPVYVLTGRLVYSLFAESTNFAMDAITSNGQLIRKVYVPKYFFPLSRVVSSFVTNFMSIVPLILVMLSTGIKVSIMDVLIIIPLLILSIIAAGIGLILCTINVFFRDIKHLYSVCLILFMYSTPIFYPAEIIPERFALFFEFNPLFPVLRMFREIILNSSFPNIQDLSISLIYGGFYLTSGLILFYKTQDKFISRL